MVVIIKPAGNGHNKIMYMKSDLKEKLYKLFVGLGVTILYVLAVKYIFPLIWPIVIGFILAKLISPIVYVLKKYMRFNDGVASAVVLTIVIGIICGLIAIGGVYAYRWIGNIVRNRDHYGEQAYRYLCGICSNMENTFGIEKGILTRNVIVFCNNKINKFADTFFGNYMGNGIGMVKAAADVLIACAVIYVCAVLMAKDIDGLWGKVKKSLFGNEIIQIYSQVKEVFVTYLKSQMVIMTLTAVICVITMMILGINNGIFIGILIGFLDALPMIGVGIILIPWSIISLFSGEYLTAAVLLLAFIVCTFVRELLEPKLIGNKIGIHPVMSLLTLFAGYKLFGILGFILGPAGFVIVKTICRLLYLGDVKEKQDEEM